MKRSSVPSPESTFLNRLFKTATGDRERLEDFLTEILAELFNQLARPQIETLLCDFFELDRSSLKLDDPISELSISTQVSINVPRIGVKRPDLILYRNGMPVALIECKVSAGYTLSVMKGEENEPDRQLEQLEVYGRWLHENGDPAATLVLLTQYSLPPDDFQNNKDFPVNRRKVLRWSDLYAFLGTSRTSAMFSDIPVARYLCEFLQARKLMINDIQVSDIAAAQIYFGSRSHERLMQCIKEASQPIRALLNKNGITSAPRGTPNIESDAGDTYLYDHLWNTTVTVEWGFCFIGDSDTSTWEDFEPDWPSVDCTFVNIQIKDKPIVRPTSNSFPDWLFPNSLEHGLETAWKLRPLHDLLGRPESTKRIGEWLYQSVFESIEIMDVICKTKR